MNQGHIDYKKLVKLLEKDSDDKTARFVKELVATSPSQRDWCGICISLLVIAAISLLILISVIILTPEYNHLNLAKRELRLSDITDARLRPINFQPKWINDDELVFRNDVGDVVMLTASSGSKHVLVDHTVMEQYGVETFSVSPDRKFVLLGKADNSGSSVEPAFLYWVYQIDSRYIHPVSLKRAASPTTSKHLHLDHATWFTTAPTHLSANQSHSTNTGLVLVDRGSVFYRVHALDRRDRLVSAATADVTHASTPVLYRDHIFGTDVALWTSPRGSQFVFLSFNQSLVARIPLTSYDSGSQNGASRISHYHYSQAGQPVPEVKVTLVEIDGSGQIEKKYLNPPDSLVNNTEAYVTSVVWMSDGRVSVTWVARDSMTCHITICSPPRWRCSQIFHGSSPERCPALSSMPVFTPDGRRVALTLGRTDFSNNFVHVVNTENGSVRSIKVNALFITVKRWHNDLIYFEGIPGRSAAACRHLFTIDTSQYTVPITERSAHGQDRELVQCVTCPHIRCLTTTSEISESGHRSAIQSDSTDGVSQLFYHHLAETDGNYSSLSADRRMSARLANISTPQSRWLRVTVANQLVHVRVRVPSRHVDDNSAFYPTVITLNWRSSRCHAGKSPVEERVGLDWQDLIVEEQLVAAVDVELPFLPVQNSVVSPKATHPATNSSRAAPEGLIHTSGTAVLQLLDQLKSKLPFINSRQLVLLGVGAGGYQALSALMTSQDRFNCVVAVAPITNLRYYASIYSESLLGNVTRNSLAYSRSELHRQVRHLAGKHVLLVHGMDDTTVSVRQSLLLAESMQRQNILFSQMIYPDQGHCLNRVSAHLYKTVSDFTQRCHRHQLEKAGS